MASDIEASVSGEKSRGKAYWLLQRQHSAMPPRWYHKYEEGKDGTTEGIIGERQRRRGTQDSGTKTRKFAFED